jgi:signal transduction histidine kinase
MLNNQEERSLEKKRYHQLEILYDISKAIGSFETVEKTFPFLMSLAAKAITIQSAALTEGRGGKITDTIWPEKMSQEQINQVVTLGNKIYSQLIGPTTLEGMPKLEGINYIALPLIAYPPKVFGVLLLVAVKKFDENDLAFADAISNLIAISLDRYHVGNDLEIFQQKFIEDLESERDLRESFVSTLAHDLRNSLGTTKLNAGIIFNKSDSPDCKKMSQKIINSIERVDLMIENLLDANRIHVGDKLTLNVEEFNMIDLLKAMSEDLSEVSAGRIIITGDQKISGFWSRNGVRRALDNLVGNALKYGSPDQPITVSLQQIAEKVQIAVHNKGNPIHPKDLPILFQIHKRTKSAEASDVRGWGLGLTLVKGMVEAHGGTVEVESTPEKGTTFTMILPRDCRPYQQETKLLH